MTCCFFGHRDTPSSVRERVKDIVEALIQDGSADRFLVGNNGAFDRIVTNILSEIQKEYPHIRCYTVLAYLNRNDNNENGSLETLYPEGMERVPLRFCIDKRNRWMLEQSEIVIGYVCNSFGGAAKFFSRAKRQNKTVFNLAESI